MAITVSVRRRPGITVRVTTSAANASNVQFTTTIPSSGQSGPIDGGDF